MQKLSRQGSVLVNDAQGPRSWVVGIQLGWGKPRLRQWGHANGSRARGGLNSSKNAETELPELGFSERRAGSLVFE